jgi:hypothetical protein
MSFGGELPIIQGVQEKLLARRPQSLRRSRVAWMAPDRADWNNITLAPDETADPVIIDLMGTEHLAVAVTAVSGFGSLQVECQERNRTGTFPGSGFLLRAVVNPSLLGAGSVVIFGSAGDFFTDGLHGDSWTLLLMETSGTDSVTFTASLYVTVN